MGGGATDILFPTHSCPSNPDPEEALGRGQGQGLLRLGSGDGKKEKVRTLKRQGVRETNILSLPTLTSIPPRARTHLCILTCAHTHSDAKRGEGRSVRKERETGGGWKAI